MIRSTCSFNKTWELKYLYIFKSSHLIMHHIQKKYFILNKYNEKGPADQPIGIKNNFKTDTRLSV